MANLQIRMPNGDIVSGPAEEWIAAIVATFTDEHRAVVVERLFANRERGGWQRAGGVILGPSRVTCGPDGRKHYRLDAESGVIGLKL